MDRKVLHAVVSEVRVSLNKHRKGFVGDGGLIIEGEMANPEEDFHEQTRDWSLEEVRRSLELEQELRSGAEESLLVRARAEWSELLADVKAEVRALTARVDSFAKLLDCPQLLEATLRDTRTRLERAIAQERNAWAEGLAEAESRCLRRHLEHVKHCQGEHEADVHVILGHPDAERA